MVMHCASLDAAKAAVLPIVRKRGGDEALKSLRIYNDGRMCEWSDERGRGYTAYVAETPTGESSWGCLRGKNTRRNDDS
jgi:hypothetical protein